MKLQFWSIGKQHEAYVEAGIALFTKRIMAYYPVQWQLITPLKNAGKLPPDQLKLKEGELVISLLKKDDYLILLDEKGKTEKSKDKLKIYDDHITTIRQIYVEEYTKTFKEQSKKI
jgi:23S rRNA (pseudouridine1915-N3)-methyltransferase